MIFFTYDELTDSILDRVEAAIEGRPEIEVKCSYSNVSCSAYLNVRFIGDDDDIFGGCKIRFSDHRDRYGSDLSVRFDHFINDDLDRDDPDEIFIDDFDIDYMVKKAVDFISDEIVDQSNGACNAIVANPSDTEQLVGQSANA